MNKKTIKKYMAGFMVIAFLSGTLAPMSLVFAADEKITKGELELKKLTTGKLINFDGEEKVETFSANENLKKSADVKQSQKQNYVEGEVLVKFKEQKINLEQLSGRMKSAWFATGKNLDKKEDIRKSNISVFKTKSDESAEAMVERLKNDSNVEYAEPNYIRQWTSITPNDTNFSKLWGLHNTTKDADIDAPEAWDIFTGSNSVVVAVLDSGIAYNHPDLINNMWSGNTNHGWDFFNDDDNPLDDNGHGTHVAGTIGAEGNNGIGITGVNWDVELMALKVGSYDGNVGDIVEAIDFAINNGVKIINASFNGSENSQAEYDAIDRFRQAGGIFIAAAGNGGADQIGDNNDSSPQYPADYALDNIISVAATDQNDNLTEWSNYGVTAVDVGAPGVNIYSTVADTNVFSENFEDDIYKVGHGGTDSHWIIGYDGFSKVAYSDNSYPYLPDAYTWLMQKEDLDLSGSSIVGATLGFTIWCDTPISATFDDYIYTSYHSGGSWYYSTKYDELQINLDGGSSWIDNGHTGYYKRYTENISDYLTNDFKFSFDWITDSSIDYNYGCTIDDIVITKYTDGSDENYDYADGTSMAAPHVTGLAALIWGYNSELSYSEVKNVILTTGDDLTSLDGKTVTGKRINAFNALNSLIDLTAPELSEVNPVPTPTNDNAPDYTFSSDEAGTINYSGGCVSDTTDATEDDNTITFDELDDGVYGGCAITVTDANNNESAALSITTFTIDTTPPVITLSGINPVELLLDEDYTEYGATAEDNIDGDISGEIEIDDSSIDTSTTGTYEVTYNVSDAAGNEADEVIRTVNVGEIPNTPPVMESITLEPNPAYTNTDITATAVASDGNGDIVTFSYQWERSIGIDESFEDIAGETNDTLLSDNFVKGNIIKVEVIPNDGTIDGDPMESDPITISNSIPTQPTVSISPNPAYANNDLTCIPNGSTDADSDEFNYAYQWYKDDVIQEGYTSNTVLASQIAAGDVWKCSVVADDGEAQSVTGEDSVTILEVPDTTPPVIVLLGDNPTTVEFGVEYEDAGATAADDVDGDITGSIVAVNNVDTSILGSYSVTYNVIDSSSNQAPEVVRTVNVVDTVVPVITLIGDDAVDVEVGYEYNDNGATASDNYDGDITDSIATVNNVDTNTVGTYSVTYNVSDSSGNAATEVIRTVIVGPDLTSPVITLNGGDMNIYAGSTYIDSGATASDNIDGDITGSIVIVDNVDANTVGTYSVTYNVSDTAGNSADEVVRIITVLPVEEEQVMIAADMDISSSFQEILIGSNAPATSNINVPSDATNAKLNVSALMSGTDVTLPTGLTINSETSIGEVNVQIPQSTLISGEAGWTGEINLPQVQENSSVSATPDSGNTATVSSVIEIGFGDTLLNFDKAVRIKITGQAGKYVGYSRNDVFTPITNACSADSQAVGDALAEGSECKINVGSDLVIWTKHFTKFATYTQTAITTSTNTGGGGGGGGVSVITPTNYSVKINSNATSTDNRNVRLTLAATNAVSMAVSNEPTFTGISFETYATTKDWTLSEGVGQKTVYVRFRSSSGVTVNTSVSINLTASVLMPLTPSVASSASQGQVLGEQKFAEGALIRAIGDIDVYIVKYMGEKQFKRLILSPSVFNSYQHLEWSDILDIEKSVVDSFVTSELVRAVNDEKVYKLYPNGDIGEKCWIETSEIFVENDFDWDAIYEINAFDRDSYITGQNIK